MRRLTHHSNMWNARNESVRQPEQFLWNVAAFVGELLQHGLV